ncbi:unnamed protein product [Rotaria sordida]|uniref:Ice-binding protein C-terminal domain-containing protein n=1 Tax=Rotaria sordida TaxID=392033 RepID=A0A813WDM9_9BILA|nr:unnamed protein product [Rotaria sordida]
MKFQLKAMVAALAFSAVSMSAQAAIDLGSTGNGSFVLSLWNQASGTSATFDLGVNYSSFSDLTSGSINLAAGNYASAWNTFNAASTTGTTLWSIFAGDVGLLGGETARTAGAYGFYTTSNSLNLDTLPATQSVFNVIKNMDTYIGANNNLGNHNSVANGASTASLNEAAGAGSVYGTGAAGGAGPASGAAFGSSQQIVHVLNGAATRTESLPPTASFAANATGANYTFTLSSAGLLSVGGNVTTPVPEADSYAMLLAGLGVIGLVARRRKA